MPRRSPWLDDGRGKGDGERLRLLRRLRLRITLDGVGTGWACVLTFQRTIARSGTGADALSFSIEARSRNFAALGARTAFNPYSYIVGGSYNATISDAIYAGVDARYSRGRDGEPDVNSVRGTIGWRITPSLNFTGDAGYERDREGGRVAAFLSLTYSLDRQSTVRTDYDSRFNRTRVAYQTYRGTGTGAYNLTADVERSDVSAGLTANGTYFTNRAELGFSHFGSFDRDLGSSTDQRTSLRFGTALAVADGAFSVGRTDLGQLRGRQRTPVITGEAMSLSIESTHRHRPIPALSARRCSRI